MLLLPPSEGKAQGGSSRRAGWTPESGAFGSRLSDRRIAVVEALASIGGGDEKLLGVKGEYLLRAQSANSSLIGAATLPAWQRYTGVVWDHLEPGTLPAAARRQIVVVSGLLGLVRGDDPIPDYRLKMSANLRPLGKLSTWWRDDLSAELRRVARRRFVVDLLPQEHRAALDLDGLDGVLGDARRPDRQTRRPLRQGRQGRTRPSDPDRRPRRDRHVAPPPVRPRRHPALTPLR